MLCLSALGVLAEATMSADEGIKPDLRAIPDTCGVWHVQGCTDRGLDWLATEIAGKPAAAVVVLDEDIPELADGARKYGLVFVQLAGLPA